MRLVKVLFFLTLSSILYAQITDYSEIRISSYEQWNINGEIYEIAQTVITGSALFTVHAVVDHQPVMDDYNEEIAKKIAIFAVQNGYLENALLLNKYSEQFYIMDGIIGVALIKILNPITQEMSGAKFAFELNEISSGIENISTIELPVTFTYIAQSQLKENISDIIATRRFDDLYNLFSKNTLDIIDEDSRLQLRVIFSLAKEYIFDESESFTIYIGEQNGVKTFHHYIPITVIPVSDETQKLKAFLQVLIIDEIKSYGIHGIMLNFTDLDSMRILHGVSGSVKFPVVKD